jgi:large subunit ribosomal protein L7A
MHTELKQGKKVVGLKQSQRAVSAGQALKAYIAQDAATQLQADFTALCAEHAVETVTVNTMLELGHACGIKIGASVAVLLQ